MPPAPSPSMGTYSEAQAPVRNLFTFNHKPNTLDRDRIVVPAGWDSWGKITVMRDGFDAKMWGEAWEKDLEADSGGEGGAKRLYTTLVPDQGQKVSHCRIRVRCFFCYNSWALFQPPPLPPFNNPTPEQAFLAKNYDENSKKSDRDPRGPFRNPADLAGASAGIVGPLGSSSFDLPNVVRALSEMETGIGGPPAISAEGAPRRAPAVRTAASGRPTGLSTLGTSGMSPTHGAGRTPTSPAPATSTPSPTTGGQTQHEVLQNFFQSLLSSKDRPGASAAAASRPRVNGNTHTTEDANN
jgi:dynein light intermediate chain 1